MDVRGVSALVTGGASGLGLAAGRRLARAGAAVVLLDLPSSPGEQAARSLPGTAVFSPGDVTDEAAVAEAVDAADRYAPLRVVVNCAGIGPPARVVAKDGTPHSLAGFAKVVQVNLVGTFNVLRLSAARMVENEPVAGERGVVVNTASAAAYDGQIGQAAYAASKGGVAALTLPVARDLADRLIRCVAIAPGLFDTPLLAGLPEAAKASLAGQVPHPRRLGDPDEFGALVEHVVANPMLNGEVIRLDGAIRMAPR
jgi:NAD(P)-dependent dehydrogenase (short-subunit alcohol dehydrogenase family)